MKLLLGILFAGLLLAADDAPEWVRQAAGQTVPSYAAKVTQAVLFQEESVTMTPDGQRTMRVRRAIKILQKTSDAPTARRTYNTKSGHIRDFQAWLVTPAGAATRFGKDRIIDIAFSRDPYEEERTKVLECPATAAAGSVFAYEIVEEEKSVFTQYQYWFQGSNPVLLSRFVLTLPAAWSASATVFNHAPLEPKAAAGVSTWELRDLPWIEDEKYSPENDAVVPRLGVTVIPTENAAGLRALKDWGSVSEWLAGLSDPPAEITEAVRRKASEIAGSAATELDKIRAIGAFVQQTNYVSIQMNMNRGGGYAPHRADEILAKNYGDCKDKSTLMRALLAGVGISSYMTSIFSSDREFVRPEWASPTQFDHAIVAIRVSPSTNLPLVFEHPRLGRLLMFDPTDYATPVGDLPSDEQGSHALVIAGARGELVRMPVLPAAANRVESTVTAKMDLAGRLEARTRGEYYGQAASPLRAMVKRVDNDALRRMFERGVSARIGGVAITQIGAEDKDGRLQLTVDYGAEHFAQSMQNMLLVKAGALVLGGTYSFPAGERKLPVKLSAELSKGSVRIKLPDAFKVDEMPEAVRLESPYGHFEASWKFEGGEIVFEESLEVREALVPASEYAALRTFFGRVGGGQAAPVVLVSR